MSPNVHALSDAASASFSRMVACPAQGCDNGAVHDNTCEVCGGEGRVTRRGFTATLRGVLAALARESIYGAFDVRAEGHQHLVTWRAEGWSRSDERRALYLASEALARAGWRASNLPGFSHVRVSSEVACAA